MTMTALDWNALAQTSAIRIVDCLVEGSLIALFAGLVLKASRQRNSGTRFAVWFSALVAIAALPLVNGVWSWRANLSPGVIATRSAIVLPASWAFYLLGAWTTVSAALLARVGSSLFHLRTLRRSCVAIDPLSLDVALRATMERNSTTRQVALCVSHRVHVPTAIGFGKPAVIIPRWLMDELSPAELHQVLLHELAHLRRWDDWTNLAQKIVKALLFFSSCRLVD